jgi:hypothetical protein
VVHDHPVRSRVERRAGLRLQLLPGHQLPEQPAEDVVHLDEHHPEEKKVAVRPTDVSGFVLEDVHVGPMGYWTGSDSIGVQIRGRNLSQLSRLTIAADMPIKIERNANFTGAFEEIGVSVATYRDWEMDRQGPDLRNVPAAIRFLGFGWRPQNITFGARIHRTRTAAGLSITQLAALLRADQVPLASGRAACEHHLIRRSVEKLEQWLSRAAAEAPTS